MSGITAQGSILQIGGAAGGAKTLTAMTPGNPTIFTSAAHGLNNGDIGAVAAVVGTVAAAVNGTNRIIANKTPNTFAFLDLDSTGLTYTSGGTFTPATFTKINGLQSFTGFDGQASELDNTDMDSTAMEFLLGLKDEGKFTLGIKVIKTDPGQIALRAARTSGLLLPLRLTIPDGSIATFNVLVKSFPTDGAVNAILKASIETRITGAVVWS